MRFPKKLGLIIIIMVIKLSKNLYRLRKEELCHHIIYYKKDEIEIEIERENKKH